MVIDDQSIVQKSHLRLFNKGCKGLIPLAVPLSVGTGDD